MLYTSSNQKLSGKLLVVTREDAKEWEFLGDKLRTMLVGMAGPCGEATTGHSPFFSTDLSLNLKDHSPFFSVNHWFGGYLPTDKKREYHRDLGVVFKVATLSPKDAESNLRSFSEHDECFYSVGDSRAPREISGYPCPVMEFIPYKDCKYTKCVVAIAKKDEEVAFLEEVAKLFHEMTRKCSNSPEYRPTFLDTKQLGVFRRTGSKRGLVFRVATFSHEAAHLNVHTILKTDEKYFPEVSTHA